MFPTFIPEWQVLLIALYALLVIHRQSESPTNPARTHQVRRLQVELRGSHINTVEDRNHILNEISEYLLEMPLGWTDTYIEVFPASQFCWVLFKHCKNAIICTFHRCENKKFTLPPYCAVAINNSSFSHGVFTSKKKQTSIQLSSCQPFCKWTQAR